MLEVLNQRSPHCHLHPAKGAPRPHRFTREMYAEGGVEPRLEELLTDPLTEALMRRDGVSVGSLRELITSTRKGLRQREAAL